MNDGGPQPANVDTNDAYRRMMQGQGGSGAAPILLGFSLEVSVGSGFSSQGIANKNILVLPNRRPGPFASFLKQLNLNAETLLKDFKEIGDKGAFQQTPFQQTANISAPDHGLGSIGLGGGSHYMS